MPPITGVDISDNQAATLPWPAWFARGYRVCVARKTLGFYDDTHFARYVTEAYAAGFTVGAYHAILAGQYREPVRQAQDFLENMPQPVAFLVLDIEAQGVSAGDVITWVAYVTSRTTMPLLLYGNWLLSDIVGRAPTLRRFGVWWAGYPTMPPTATAPPWPTPRGVPAGLRVVAWQWAGDGGRLPPYMGAIDLSVWYELPAPVVPPPPPPADTLAAAVAERARAILELV